MGKNNEKVICIKNNEAYIRMGKDNSFIKGIVLSDDSVLVNMNCSSDVTIPDNEEIMRLLFGNKSEYSLAI